MVVKSMEEKYKFTVADAGNPVTVLKRITINAWWETYLDYLFNNNSLNSYGKGRGRRTSRFLEDTFKLWFASNMQKQINRFPANRLLLESELSGKFPEFIIERPGKDKRTIFACEMKVNSTYYDVKQALRMPDKKTKMSDMQKLGLYSRSSIQKENGLVCAAYIATESTRPPKHLILYEKEFIIRSYTNLGIPTHQYIELFGGGTDIGSWGFFDIALRCKKIHDEGCTWIIRQTFDGDLSCTNPRCTSKDKHLLN